jgi:hypothetical protein
MNLIIARTLAPLLVGTVVAVTARLNLAAAST